MKLVFQNFVNLDQNGISWLTAEACTPCVYQQHQNVKLLMAAIPDNCDYKEYLVKLVYSIENHTCMMQSCDSCPGKTALKEYLTELFSTNDFDMDDSINYK